MCPPMRVELVQRTRPNARDERRFGILDLLHSEIFLFSLCRRQLMYGTNGMIIIEIHIFLTVVSKEVELERICYIFWKF